MLPKLLHGLGEPGQDLRVVSRWMPNDNTELTSGYAKGLGNVPVEVWGR